MDTDQTADMQSAEEKAYFESGGELPMPGWQNYPDIILDQDKTAAADDAHAAALADQEPDKGNTAPADGAPNQRPVLRPASPDPQGDAILGAIEESLTVFTGQTPAFEHALEYLSQRRDAELAAFGIADKRMQSAAFRSRYMQDELQKIVVSAISERRNPAAVIYEIACTYGFGDDDASQTMSLEKLAAMSEDNFADWYENNKQGFRQLMGG